MLRGVAKGGDSRRLHGVASEPSAVHYLVGMRCSVCGAQVESIHVRKADSEVSVIAYVEETINCANGHTVMRLTNLASMARAARAGVSD